MAEYTDIAPALLETLQTAFAEKLQTLPLPEVTGRYLDAENYAVQMGEALAEVLAEHLSSVVLPDGKMYYNIADRVLRPLLEQDHKLVAQQCAAVLDTANAAAGISLKAQRAPVNTDRIDGLVDLACSTEQYDEVAGELGEAVINFSQAVSTDTLKTNMNFWGKAGLRPKIIRSATGKCCNWCQKLAGAYTYPDTPKDVYRRHADCRCTVDYDPGGAKRFQNVHNKEWKTAEDYGRVLQEKLHQKNRGKKVFITDQAINKVRKISLPKTSEDIVNYIYQTHKDLLMFSRSENFSDEVVGLVNLTNNSRLRFLKGSKDSADPEADADYYHALRTAPKRSLLICHNHPGLSYFSLNDISFFMAYDSIKTMTIVTNQGSIRYISKTDNFDIAAARDCMYNAIQGFPKDPDKIVAYFLKNCYTYGVERN